ncbi:GFA family protein [Mesobacterium pallidum]|uniref:GFA family protein n=1 Tax=Mesobacterium pallidum TaxID=2872037 RepID=UPI002342D8BC|nr:GFA family protein [Mesobacterium pallidum]
MAEMTGQCLCGAMTYELAAAPQRVTICYCRFCQRATGSTQAVLPVLPLADLSVSGEERVHRHVSKGSGKEVHIHFCAACGTNVYVSYERWPGMVGLFAGTLDGPVSLDPATTKQIFVSSARPGTVIAAGIPAFWEHAATLDGAAEEPFVLEVATVVEGLRRG